jgi:Clp amino terminal domain, pathogenicity island component
VDLSLLLLVAAAVRGLSAEESVSDLDIEAAQECLDVARQRGAESPVHQACALLCSMVQERPFAYDNDLIALLVAAQLLDDAGVDVTFEPTPELWAVLDQIRSSAASLDDVVGFVRAESRRQKEKPAMFERFTPRARQVLSEAKTAAETLRHNFIGTEHLLLGLLSVEDGIGAQVLNELGVGSDEVRRRVEELVGPGPKAVVNNFPFTPRSKKTLELALRSALSFGHNYIGTEHILLGLLDLQDGVAVQILESMGVTARTAEEKVTTALAVHGWTPSKKVRRRMRLQQFPSVTFQSTNPAARVRNQRLLQEMTAIITENDALRAEVNRLRHVLEEHNLDPGQAGTGDQPA